MVSVSTESWIGCGDFSVFFDEEIYEGKIIPLSQLKEEIFTYFAEHLRRPTSRLAFWNGEDWSHHDGTSYRDMFSKAQAFARTQVIKERYVAEGKGWENAGRLAEDKLPFVIVSLPADVYRTKYGAKNMTYLVMKVGDIEDKQVWRVLSIPSNEMNALEHVKAVLPVVGKILERDSEYLVSNPQIAVALLGEIESISKLDLMAVNLGYSSYQEILDLANTTLMSESDPESSSRRELMVDFFAQSFYDAQSNVFYSDRKRSVIQRVLSEAMRYFFAMEAGSEYLGKKFDNIADQIELYISDGVNKIELRESRESFATLSDADRLMYWEIVEREGYRMRVLESNREALDSYRVTGCVTTISMGGGNYWNQLNLDFNTQRGLNNLFGGELIVGYESGKDSENNELKDGDTACYPCPLCGGEVKRRGSELVCQKNPADHHIQYQPQAD